jgi:hypothetical protein
MGLLVKFTPPSSPAHVRRRGFSCGAFPRLVLAEGDYHVIARNDSRTFQRDFKVITGVDGEVEVSTR